jgi:hypothetical protein
MTDETEDDTKGPLMRRRLAAITAEDTDTGGRPLLWAYGPKWLMAIAKRKRSTLDKAIAAGFTPENPIEAICWLLEKRGRADVAIMVREILRTD